CRRLLPLPGQESLRHYRESRTGFAERVAAPRLCEWATRQSLLDPTPTVLQIRWRRRRLLPSLSAAPAWGFPNSPVPRPRLGRKGPLPRRCPSSLALRL